MNETAIKAIGRVLTQGCWLTKMSTSDCGRPIQRQKGLNSSGWRKGEKESGLERVDSAGRELTLHPGLLRRATILPPPPASRVNLNLDQ